MVVQSRLTFMDEEGEKFFGEGPDRLLRAVEEHGSLHSAAQSMGMAYTKAMKLLKNAEKYLGYPLTVRSIGGVTGGGSILTEEAKEFLLRYETYRDQCVKHNKELFRQQFQQSGPMFPSLGCVIMASGMGVRFGSNKLMEELEEEPVIAGALKATEGLFGKRVVVTRHKEVEVYCQEKGIDVILHELPYRSDTVRLGTEVMKEMEGCIFCQGDQPMLQKETVIRLCQDFLSEPQMIHRVHFGEEVGAPVIFPKWSFEELLSLPEGKGGGFIVKRYPEKLRLSPAGAAWELMDVDTPEDLEKLKEIVNQ